MGIGDEIMMLLRNHPGNYKELRSHLLGNDLWLLDRKMDEEILRKRQKAKENAIRVALWRLHKNGMIESKNGSWLLTKLGKSLASRSNLLKRHLSYPVAPKSKKKIIISFDIPESHRKYRNWLRIELAHLDFKIMQKSVWLGPAPLPKEFIEALKERELFSYLKFFEAKESQIV